METKGQPSIYALIYERAQAKGITIERGPHHRENLDYIGSGVRVVRFPNSQRVYEYRDTLINIGLRLDLITEQEYTEHHIKHGCAVCPKCGALQEARIIEQFGYCLNC